MKNREARSSIFILVVIAMLSFASAAFAGTYWVSSTGMAKWANCQGKILLSGISACSLSMANSNASAGDTIYLRAGTYNTGIAPSNSGSPGNIITYQSYTGETPVIDSVATGISLSGKDYIKIEGIEISNVTSELVRITRGADYNEIANCIIHDSTGIANGGVNIWTNNANDSTKNTHNWIHNNTIYHAGGVDPNDCNDISNLMKIGIGGTDQLSSNNTIENNIMYGGGHHVIQINSKNNVIRGNVFHNEGWMAPKPVCTLCTDGTGKYGNRNQAMDDGESNLVENNRYGHAGLPSDGNGATGLATGGMYNIIRYNFLFANQGPGIYLRYGTNYNASYTHLYNNTLYHNGFHSACRPNEQDYGIGIHSVVDNMVIKNNLLYDQKNTEKEIWCINGGGGTYNCDSKNSTFAGNWLDSDGDPLFVDTNISDPTSTTLPNLSLQKGSGAINAGTYLTRANGSGTSSTALVVDDALYFQDGTWGSSLSNIQADWIAIGTVSNGVQISSIDYSTNRITLKSPVTWSSNANIWLYKDSSGKIVLWGSAPDIGASEFNTSVPAKAPSTVGRNSDKSGGCSCIMPGQTGGTTNWLGIFGLLGIVVALRRRRNGK